MKKRTIRMRIVVSVSLLLLGILIFNAGIKVGAASSEPGSAGDPLITKSYLDQRLSEFEPAKAAFVKATVAKGKTLALAAGTELILYSGSGTVRGTGGLINLSSGELFQNGTSAVLYSLYFAPSSSAGIEAASAMTVFIRGTYQIK